MTKVVALCSCGCQRVSYARGLAKPCYHDKHGKRCSVADCDSKVHAKGLCTRHYNEAYYRKTNDYRGGRHDGLVRVAAKGWGSIA